MAESRLKFETFSIFCVCCVYRYSEIECLVETHQSMIKDVGKVGPTALLRRGLLMLWWHGQNIRW